MAVLSRRAWLKGMGAGALGLAAAPLSSAFYGSGLRVAQAQGAPTASAFYRLNVGGFQVTVIQDATNQFPSSLFGTNAPEGAIDALLAENNLPTGLVNSTFNVTLVNTGDRLVLLDTGLGISLLPTLALLGIDPADVTDVIITHFHPDHVGGVSVDGALNFPNATHYISQIEFDLLTGGATGSPMDNMIAGANAALAPLADGQLLTYSDEDEIVPGIQAVATLGHTPGHHTMLIASGGSQLMTTADTANHFLIALAHPEYFMGFDAMPELAAESRRALLQRAVDEQLQILGYHFPFPGIGYVAANGEGFRFVAAI